MNAVKFPTEIIRRVENIILLERAKFIPLLIPEYLFFSDLEIDNLGILYKNNKFILLTNTRTKYSLSRFIKFIKNIPIFGPINHAAFNKIIFRAIPALRFFLPTKFAK